MGLEPEDKMKSALFRENLARCLGSNDIAEKLGGKYNGAGYGQCLTGFHTR